MVYGILIVFNISKQFQSVLADGIMSCVRVVLAVEEGFLSCAALNGVLANLK